MVLGVPLHARHKRWPRPVQCFHHAIVGQRLHVHALTQPAHRLVVARYDQAFADGQPPTHGRISHQRDHVGVVFAGIRAVGNGAFQLAGHVLVQASAKGHVEQLHAPANTKDGFSLRQERIYKAHLVRVVNRIPGPVFVQRMLPVMRGAHVGAALKQQTVADVGVIHGTDAYVLHCRRMVHRRNQKRQKAHGCNPLRQVLIHRVGGFAQLPGVVFLRFCNARRDAHNGWASQMGCMEWHSEKSTFVVFILRRGRCRKHTFWID